MSSLALIASIVILSSPRMFSKSIKSFSAKSRPGKNNVVSIIQCLRARSNGSLKDRP